MKRLGLIILVTAISSWPMALSGDIHGHHSNDGGGRNETETESTRDFLSALDACLMGRPALGSGTSEDLLPARKSLTDAPGKEASEHNHDSGGQAHKHGSTGTPHSHADNAPGHEREHQHGHDKSGQEHVPGEPEHSHSSKDPGHNHSSESAAHRHDSDGSGHDHGSSDVRHGPTEAGHSHDAGRARYGQGTSESEHKHGSADASHTHHEPDPTHTDSGPGQHHTAAADSEHEHTPSEIHEHSPVNELVTAQGICDGLKGAGAQTEVGSAQDEDLLSAMNSKADAVFSKFNCIKCHGSDGHGDMRKQEFVELLASEDYREKLLTMPQEQNKNGKVTPEEAKELKEWAVSCLSRIKAADPEQDSQGHHAHHKH